MSIMKTLIVVVTLGSAGVSFAAKSRPTSAFTQTVASKVASTFLKPTGTILMTPTPKNADPGLAMGLGRNPAECPFKDHKGLDRDSNGVRYGKKSTGIINSANLSGVGVR